MNSRRSSINDYPEHLNPFHDSSDKWHFWGKLKRSGSFSNSLKDLRNTITLRSFRGPKKSKYDKDGGVEIRNRTVGSTTLSRQTFPVTYRQPPSTSTPLLPRSRFRERVRKSIGDPEDSSYDSSKNPFENEDDDGNSNELKPEDYRKKVRRRKRKAPLPPGVKDSSWSLTSVETDISSYPHSEVSDLDVSEIEKPMAEICEMLQSFTKEIERMTDSFNSSNAIKVDNEEYKDDDMSKDREIICPEIIITSVENTYPNDKILVLESVSYTYEQNGEPSSNGLTEVQEKQGCEKIEKISEIVEPNQVRNENGCDFEKTGLEVVEKPGEEPEKESVELEQEVKKSTQEIIEPKQVVDKPELDPKPEPEPVESIQVLEKCDQETVEPNQIKQEPVQEKPEHKSVELTEKVLEPKEKESIQENPEHQPVVLTEKVLEPKENILEEPVIEINGNGAPLATEEILRAPIAVNEDQDEGKHFSRDDYDIKYIDESFTIHDRVIEDSDIRNNLQKSEANNNNNSEYIPNGSYKENKFPVEDTDLIKTSKNGNDTKVTNISNNNVVNQNDEPPVPKVRKKKFTKSKLLGFFSGK